MIVVYLRQGSVGTKCGFLSEQDFTRCFEKHCNTTKHMLQYTMEEVRKFNVKYNVKDLFFANILLREFPIFRLFYEILFFASSF